MWALPRPVNSVTGQFYYTKEQIRKQHLSKYYNQYINEYADQLSIHLRYGGVSYAFNVNRLVYELFVGPLDVGDDRFPVVHKDGDNCNNRFDNMVLMSGTELNAHRLKVKHEPRSGRAINRVGPFLSGKNAPRPIVQYTLAGEKSIIAAAKEEGIEANRISAVVNGQTKSAGGDFWKLKTELTT